VVYNFLDMCRFFGFRSNSPTEVHRSLLTEKNSLRAQSTEHPDGWGIAFYRSTSPPEVAHGIGPAHSDPEFERVSNFVSSQTVLAHVRLASVGAVHLRNSHPFIFGRWAFAHNGTLTQFAKHQAEIEAGIDPKFLPRIRSETDSERCFYLFLTRLEALSGLGSPGLENVARALVQTTSFVAAITDHAGGKPSGMNFLVTNGSTMAASRRHRTLFYSARSLFPESASGPGVGIPLSQLVIASEQLCGESHWRAIDEASVIGTDADLVLRLWKSSELGS